MKKEFKIAPSKLTFLYDDCKRCFWNDIHGVWKRPYTPFPSIFNKIDKVMRDAYHGQPVSLYLPRSGFPSPPPGHIDTSVQRLKSQPISVGSAAFVFSGSLDAKVKFKDNSIGIIDFKTSQPKPENVDLYRRQLMAYADIFRHPEEGSAVPTSCMGLICVVPIYMNLMNPGEPTMAMKATYQPIPIDWEWWQQFCLEIAALLEGDRPEVGKPDCLYCEMQRAMQS